MSEKMKHLEMIQGVINRMAGNSFMLKGWAVTLVAGFFVLSGKDTNEIYFLIAFVPTVGFWFLDTYYLLQERLYRSLYNTVRQKNINDIDFNMAADQIDWKDKLKKYGECFFSMTELCFYFPFTLLILAIIFCVI